MAYLLRSLLATIGALGLIIGFLVILTAGKDISSSRAPALKPSPAQSTQAAAVGSGVERPAPTTSPSAETAETNPPATPAIVRNTSEQSVPPPQKPSASAAEQVKSANTVTRIENPYSFAPLSFDVVNENARAALVNILCIPQSGSTQAISGSGVIIDPRGVVLTNAHVAQYVLLSKNIGLGLHCYIRVSSPAKPYWVPTVLYLPPVWVHEHASEISVQRPLGTGEHDYALLLITDSLDGSPLPSFGAGFPSMQADIREGIAFLDDQVLAASYPAEFVGGFVTQNSLYAASSITTVKQLFTFDTGTIDMLSLGGIIEAQSGSSGGGVLNAWGRLVGIITTTSEGSTTADRDLRALSMSYINRDIKAQSGYDLGEILGGNVVAETIAFTNTTAPSLVDILISNLKP